MSCAAPALPQCPRVFGRQLADVFLGKTPKQVADKCVGLVETALKVTGTAAGWPAAGNGLKVCFPAPYACLLQV